LDGREESILTDAQIAVLCDIGQSIAFSDDKQAELFRLIADGYVRKDGDTFELTAKGEAAVVERDAGGMMSHTLQGNRNEV
jgi:hypothetical protein